MSPSSVGTRLDRCRPRRTGARLGLGEADRADLGRREDRARHHFVVDGGGPAVEMVSPNAWPSRIATGRQCEAVGDVADRLDVRRRCSSSTSTLTAPRSSSATPAFSRPSPRCSGCGRSRRAPGRRSPVSPLDSAHMQTIVALLDADRQPAEAEHDAAHGEARRACRRARRCRSRAACCRRGTSAWSRRRRGGRKCRRTRPRYSRRRPPECASGKRLAGRTPRWR